MAGKYTWFDPAPDSAHSLVLSLVPPGARVLEFGCATGYMSAELSSRLGCTVTGIELSAEAAEEARQHCARVIVGDAEQLDLHALLGEERFEVILFADVLEHLRDPWALLVRVRSLLAEGGSVIASIPNVAHGSVRVALFHGEWRYRPLGLLDDTHLRFFTRDGVQDLFERGGFFVTHWLRKRHSIEGTEMGVQVPEPLQPHLEHDPEVTTFQFIVRAVASEPVEVVGALRQQVAATTAELHATRAQLEGARAELRSMAGQVADARTEIAEQARTVGDQRTHLDALRVDLSTLATTTTDLRDLLLDGHTQLLRRDEALRETIRRLEAAEGELRWLKSSRVWRLGTLYWRLLDRLKGRGES